MHYNDDVSLDAVPPAEEWKPTWWTPMKSSASLGDDIADFIEAFHTPPRGKSAIEGDDLSDGFYDEETDFEVERPKIKLHDWQRWFLRHVFELNTFGYLRYRTVYIQIPRKNGKSMLLSGIGNYFLAKGKPGDRIFCAAKDSEQARVIYEESKRNIIQSEDLSSVLIAQELVAKNRFKDIEMKPLASSIKGAHALAPYISLCDEIHTWDSATGTSRKGHEMLQSLLTGSGDRKESMVLMITTAGSNLDGIAYSHYKKGMMIAKGELEDDTFGFFCWEAEDSDPIFDDNGEPVEATLRKANPGVAGGYLDLEVMKKELQSAALLSTADFERFRLNRWLRRGDKLEFLTDFHWKEILNEDYVSLFERSGRKKRPEIVFGFDGSLTEDSTGIVAIDLESKTLEVLYKWEKDPTNPDWFVDLGEVDAAFRKCFELFDVKKVYLDPSRHWDLVKTWQKDFGKPVVRDIPPTTVRMAPMSNSFRNAVVAKEIYHNGDRRFAEHVLNAILTERGTPAKEQRNSHRKIDFLMCAILANGARMEYEDQVAKEAYRESRWNI